MGRTKADRAALRGERNPHRKVWHIRAAEGGWASGTQRQCPSRTQAKVQGNGTDTETLLEVFLLEIKDKNKFLGIPEIQGSLQNLPSEVRPALPPVLL